ncbi:NAD(P)H-binding protein [Pseudonocardia adelaidensis]|uniref:NAD(P)H-binding protein n=1 Tax=Pseudonocardia adelaidensis TaxID=648754 RepID=A0ABP9P7E0_9PSEU
MILVSGATGNVGRELVRTLVDREVPVRALTRRDGGRIEGAQRVVGDLDHPAGLRPALEGVSGLFLLPGYQDMPGVLAAARDAGVSRVVQLSGGSAGSGDTGNAISAYMIRTEEAVRACGIPWTLLRPYGFMTNALEWAPQLRSGDVVRAPFGGVRVAVIDPADIAAVAATALVEDGHAGRVYALSGPESLLPADRVRVLGEVLGRDLRFEAQPDDEAWAEMTARMPEAYVRAFFDFYVDGSLDESRVLPTVRDVTGRPPRTFADWARAHADAFR